MFTPGDHGSTFGGNPLAAAVGEAALDLLVRERLSERARVRGDELLAKLRAIDHPAIVEVRGKGLLDRRRDRPGVRERARGLRRPARARRAEQGHARHGGPLRAAADRRERARRSRRRRARRDLALARAQRARSEAALRRRRQRSANCATMPAKTAKPSQWLRRKARKQPSRVRPRISVKCQAGDRRGDGQPGEVRPAVAERDAERGPDREEGGVEAPSPRRRRSGRA